MERLPIFQNRREGMLSGLFGSRLREKILLFVWKAGDTYAYEFVKCFDTNVNAVQRQLRYLEGLGVFISFVHRGKRFYDTATTAMGDRRASVLT
jgi:hypothetical protein